MTKEGKVVASAHLQPDLYEQLKGFAEERHMSVAAAVRQAIVAYISGDQAANQPSLDTSAETVRNLEKALDRVYAETVRVGDKLARLRQDA